MATVKQRETSVLTIYRDEKRSQFEAEARMLASETYSDVWKANDAKRKNAESRASGMAAILDAFGLRKERLGIEREESSRAFA